MRCRHPLLLLCLLGLVGLTGCATEPELPPPPKVAPLTAAQEEELAAAALAEYRDYLLEARPGIELPEVERIRFVERHEWGTVHAKCMTDEGFPATPTDDGGIKFGDIPPSQAEAQSLALYTCRARYPSNPRTQQEMTAEQLDWLYDYAKLVQIPCLEELGIETNELPSRQVFAENYGKEGDWFPYSLEGVTLEQSGQANENCPSEPADFWGE